MWSRSRFNRRLSISRGFNGDSRFSTWLSRIAIKRRPDELRKKHRLLDVSLDDRPKPKSRLPGLNSKTKARVPTALRPQEQHEFFPRPWIS